MILTATAVSAGARTIMDVDRRSNTISVVSYLCSRMKIRYILTYIIGSVILCATAINAGAQTVQNTRHNVTHRVTAELRPVLNMPSHGFYRGYNEMGKAVPYAASAHLKYSFTLSPESRLGQLYPTAYQGIGIAVHSFFNHDITGTPVILYIFQGSRIADLSRKISLNGTLAPHTDGKSMR